MSQKRKRSASPHADGERSTTVFHSEKIEDRQSTFRAYFSPDIPPKDLQALPDFKNASHKMVAWRRESNQQSLTSTKRYVTGSDDDGEKHGGRNIEQVLSSMDVTGACVVARWYGGVMLGPVRFDHIKACATEAIKQYQDLLLLEHKKKRRMAEEAVEKEKLETNLAARDRSIITLRALAEQKEKALTQAGNEQDDKASLEEEPAPPASSTAPALTLDYKSMPLERLRALDKARDATLSFLLKRIDKSEKELAKITSTEPDKTPD